MAQDSPSRTLDKIIVRLPDGMRDELAGYAAENKRSVNAEVVSRLGWSLTNVQIYDEKSGQMRPMTAGDYRSAYEPLSEPALESLQKLEKIILELVEEVSKLRSEVEGLKGPPPIPASHSTTQPTGIRDIDLGQALDPAPSTAKKRHQKKR